MTRSIALVWTIVLAACGGGGAGSSSHVTKPSATVATSAVLSSEAITLLVADVTVDPRLANDAEASCRGQVTVVLDPTPRGALDLATAQFELTVTGCPPGTRITGGRLHRQGQPGNVLIDAQIAPLDLPSGIGRADGVNAGVRPSVIAEIATDPGAFVFSWTSQQHPAGGFRGELRRR